IGTARSPGSATHRGEASRSRHMYRRGAVIAMDVVEFPDPIAWAISFLKDRLGIDVGLFIPDNYAFDRENAYVAVRRSGGIVTERVLDNARLDIHVFHPDVVEAAALSGRVRSHLLSARGIVGNAVVARVREFTGPVLINDPAA